MPKDDSVKSSVFKKNKTISNKKKIRKAVIPAAGHGTRLLPCSKAIPKEMLPLVDKPIIQYIIEELVEAGIEDIFVVVSREKQAIQDHFNYHFELESKLKNGGKVREFEEMRRIAELANLVYIYQKEALGTGHAVLQAKKLIGDEPFITVWGDDLIVAEPSRINQLLEIYEQTGNSVISVIETEKDEDTLKYGMVKGKPVIDGLYLIEDLIEKPGPQKTPSRLASVSSFLLTPAVFNLLESMPRRRGREIYLSDAINLLAKTEPVYALLIKNSNYYDCGNKVEYIKTIIDLALKNKELAPELNQYLKNKIKN
jgi:UTP--glucose-1-phosphate uridylyltransferase